MFDMQLFDLFKSNTGFSVSDTYWAHILQVCPARVRHGVMTPFEVFMLHKKLATHLNPATNETKCVFEEPSKDISKENMKRDQIFLDGNENLELSMSFKFIFGLSNACFKLLQLYFFFVHTSISFFYLYFLAQEIRQSRNHSLELSALCTQSFD